MINIIILFIHILIVLFNILYVFCIKNKQYDYIYLTYVYFLILHWTFLNGECLLSYLYKKIQNNDYELGSDCKNDDLHDMFGEYRSYVVIFINIMLTINIYMVCKRNNIKNYVILMFILLFQSFSFNFSYFTYHHINTNFQFFNNIIKISLIFFGLYIYINKDNINE
jgi:hypothetical protein